MKVGEIDLVKGFMPIHEGKALTKWSQKFSLKGDILEIGTYCGKSTLYIAKGVIKNNRYVYTVDHHLGSEEHQLNEEYFDTHVANPKSYVGNSPSSSYYSLVTRYSFDDNTALSNGTTKHIFILLAP